jgi:hypothetical protein
MFDYSELHEAPLTRALAARLESIHSRQSVTVTPLPASRSNLLGQLKIAAVTARIASFLYGIARSTAVK